MKAADFCSALKKRGFNLFTGVPCSILKDTIICLQGDPDVRYVSATREDEAVGVAAGSFLGGQKPVVLMQNSGLGSSIGALASLPLLYKIPMLLVVSWRGYQGKDAPEHRIMGKNMLKLLRDFGIPTKILPKRNPEKAIAEAITVMEEQQIPVALIIKRGVVS